MSAKAQRLLWTTVIMAILLGMAFLAIRNCGQHQSSRDSITESIRRVDPKMIISPESCDALHEYAKEKGFNTNLFFLVDFKIPSKDPRFFVIDFADGHARFSALCAHGMGGGSTAEKPVFSNKVGSQCSSIGAAVITGMAPFCTDKYKNMECFLLEGLDKTNSNMRRRSIVIHSSGAIDRIEGRHINIPIGKISEGCFTVSRRMFAKLKSLYKSEENKKILLVAIK